MSHLSTLLKPGFILLENESKLLLLLPALAVDQWHETQIFAFGDRTKCHFLNASNIPYSLFPDDLKQKSRYLPVTEQIYDNVVLWIALTPIFAGGRRVPSTRPD